MQIRKIHDEHYQFKTAGQPHLASSRTAAENRSSAAQSTANSTNSQSTTGSGEITALLKDLHQISETDEAAVQLAHKRFRSGELLTREAAEFVATSLIEDFNF